MSLSNFLISKKTNKLLIVFSLPFLLLMIGGTSCIIFNVYAQQAGSSANGGSANGGTSGATVYCILSTSCSSDASSNGGSSNGGSAMTSNIHSNNIDCPQCNPAQQASIAKLNQLWQKIE